MENNMIIVKGFRMSGKFGELNLDELTLPCTKEAWEILGNLADVAGDAAEECLDTTSTSRVPTEPKVVKSTTSTTDASEVEALTVEKLPADELKTIYEQLPGQLESFNTKRISFDIGADEDIRMIFKYKSSACEQSLTVTIMHDLMHSHFVILNELVDLAHCYTSTIVDNSFKQFIKDLLPDTDTDDEYAKTREEVIRLINRYEKYIKVYS